jgi:cell division protein FtsQ
MGAASKKDSKKAPANPPTWRYLFLMFAFSATVIGGVFGAQQVEQFLTRYPRFELTPPAEYGEESPALLIDGLRYASRNQVLRVFQADVGRSLYLCPLPERRRALLRIPWVKDAAILRRWPNQLTVRITERKPAAFLQTQSEGMSAWSLIDSEGVLLDPPARVRFDLPIVAGVRLDEEQARRGTRVRRMQRLLEELGPARTRISEVDVSDLDNLKVTLKMGERAVVLILGDHNFRSRFEGFLDHYDAIRRKAADAHTLDLRLDGRIISAAEGNSGGN